MKFYYFNSTHWDREWFMPFEGFRFGLEQTFGKVLDALEKQPELEKFTFDGQTIVLEDVTEIRPEWRSRIERQVRSGRLNVGPWYVMPDEFLVSGEALIRNLLIGREIAAEYGGEAWPVGYICDIFGHLAQMPQILNGFGLELAVLWRGADSRFKPYFLWRSPDGSVIKTFKNVSRGGYSDFTVRVLGVTEADLTEACFKQRFRQYVDEVGSYFGDRMVLSDAQDHNDIHSKAPQYLQWIRELYPGSEVVHSDYRDLAADFAAMPDLPLVEGELIHTADERDCIAFQIPYTLSSRVDLKSANDRCQDMLELCIDPMQAALTAKGRPQSNAFWRYAWKRLIRNHAHDSICGCSIDAVHRDMLTRFSDVRTVGEAIVGDFIRADIEDGLGAPIESVLQISLADPERAASDVDPENVYLLRAYNTLPWQRDEVCELEIAFPTASLYPEYWAEPFFYQRIHAFRLYDEAGEEVEYHITDIRRNRYKRFYRHDARVYDLYTVVAPLRLRPGGWSRLTLRPSPTPVRFFSSQLDGRRAAANGLVRVELNADGTFDLADLRNGRTYRGLNDLAVDREIGDGWNHVRPVGMPTLSGNFQVIRAEVAEDGPARTVFEVVRRCVLPAEMLFQGTLTESYGGIAASTAVAELEITSRIAVEAASPLVKITTILDNTVRDYRLRTVMPTGVAGNCFVYQNFAFLERPPGRARGRQTENQLEAEPLEKNFSGLVGKRDDDGGLAFIARYGLHEISGAPGDAGELFITLLRAFRRTAGTDGEEDGQLLKALTFEYAVMPLTEQDDDPALHRVMQNYRAGVDCHMLPAAWRRSGHRERSWLTLEGGLSLAALKPRQDGASGKVILRLVNLTGTVQTGRIVLNTPAALREVRLDETPLREFSAPETVFRVEAGPWQLRTCELDSTGND